MRTRLVQVLAAVAVVVGLATPAAAVSPPPGPCASVSVADVDQAEGTGGGVTAFNFTVTVNAPQGCVVKGSVGFHTDDGDATAPSDYAATAGTLTWTGAPTPRTITVAVVPDSAPEADEQFWLRLDDPVGLTVTGGAAVGGIVNDDQPIMVGPTVSVDGSPKCWIVCSVGVHVTGPDPNGVTVQWQTEDNGGSNLGYVPVKDATLVIPPNAPRADITVKLQPINQQFQFPLRIFAPSVGVLGTAKSIVSVTPNG